MLAIKDNNISKLNVIKLEAVNDSIQWLNIKDINGAEALTQQYSEIYQQYHVNNKWILMINPENNSLGGMENISKKAFSKILQVNSNKVTVKVENIETALRKGNCSAVILNNASFTEEELSQLYLSAKEGNTQCIILNNKKLMH
ncbi:SulA-like leucine-rich domain-containing protein [Pseudocolwellia agarivorans]|mgnify:CR=1 FL=1|uniref:SulA-like leucine-rich domain-containing protein n=1 Tax=Pseudocolwellia agarivorans TaxID=1911682 RepID=UPI00098651C6|nr:SulA-like leucine-rich domain-containing protein [Pseudocolwellia agarivorans]